MNLRGDARGGHHSRMRAPGSSDGRAEDAPEGSDPSPPRQPWRKHERERLRRALLRFGLGRWRAVHEASRVEGRAALDVRLACFDFARAVAERARDAHVKTYLAARLADAPRASRESPSPRDRKPLRPNASTELRLFGPDPLVGPWSKVPPKRRRVGAATAAPRRRQRRRGKVRRRGDARGGVSADRAGVSFRRRGRGRSRASDDADADGAGRVRRGGRRRRLPTPAVVVARVRRGAAVRHPSARVRRVRRDAPRRVVRACFRGGGVGERRRGGARGVRGERESEPRAGDDAHQDATDAGGVQRRRRKVFKVRRRRRVFKVRRRRRKVFKVRRRRRKVFKV